MAHYAFLDDNSFVTQVIVGKDENELDNNGNNIDWEVYYGNFIGQACKRTSYNTYGGQHISGGIPFRKNFAGVGFEYRSDLDAFIPPKPYNSWILNEDTCLWEAPTPYPANGGNYKWVEDDLNWQLIESEV